MTMRKISGFVAEHLPVIVLVVIWSAVLAAFAFARHERLNSSTYDLAIKAQVIWNTYQGDWFASSIEVQHYLGDHVQLIFLALAPLFAFWEDVRVLLLLQSILLSLGAIPVYRIASRKLEDRWLAMLFALAYLLYPLIGFVNRFDFHPVVFSIPIILFTYDLLQTDRPGWASVLLFLALTLREDVGFTVFAFGLYIAIFMKRRTFGLAWAAVGLAWSLIAIFMVIPYYRGAASDTMGRYAWLGDKPLAMLTTIFSRPGTIAAHLLDGHRRLLLPKLLLPLGFLSLLSPAPLLVGLPALAYNMLSETQSQSSIYFQYLSPVVPFIFIAAVQGARRVQGWLAPAQRRLILSLSIGLALLLAWVWDNPFNEVINAPYFPVYGLERVAAAAPFAEARALLPADAQVATMMAYGPHLALRPELHLFYDRLKLEERPFGFPQSDYLLLNLSDLRWGVNARFFYNAIETAIGRFGYEVLYAREDVVLLHRVEEPQPLTGAVMGRVVGLLESGGKYAPAAEETIEWMGHQWLLDELPPSAHKLAAMYDEGPTLLAYEAPQVRAPGQAFCVTLYWAADKTISNDYTAFLHVAAADGFVQAQRDSQPVFGFYPTSKWQPGEIVVDMHCMQLPAGLASGHYDILTGLYADGSGQRLRPAAGGAENDAIRLGQLSVSSGGSRVE